MELYLWGNTVAGSGGGVGAGRLGHELLVRLVLGAVLEVVEYVQHSLHPVHRQII